MSYSFRVNLSCHLTVRKRLTSSSTAGSQAPAPSLANRSLELSQRDWPAPLFRNPSPQENLHRWSFVLWVVMPATFPLGTLIQQRNTGTELKSPSCPEDVTSEIPAAGWRVWGSLKFQLQCELRHYYQDTKPSVLSTPNGYLFIRKHRLCYIVPPVYHLLTRDNRYKPRCRTKKAARHAPLLPLSFESKRHKEYWRW